MGIEARKYETISSYLFIDVSSLSSLSLLYSYLCFIFVMPLYSFSSYGSYRCQVYECRQQFHCRNIPFNRNTFIYIWYGFFWVSYFYCCRLLPFFQRAKCEMRTRKYERELHAEIRSRHNSSQFSIFSHR